MCGSCNVGRFTIDLQTSPNGSQFDIALHVNVCHHQHGLVVRNSRTTGKWNSEECDGSPMPIKPGKPIECIMLITNHVIKVRWQLSTFSRLIVPR